jgi:nicotinamidase-related amidase
MDPDITRSALIIVDMQNDFLHPDGSFGRRAAEHPEFNIDMPFLVGTIPHVKRLTDAFRAASRPVVYVAHILKPDYSDAAFPYWRLGLQPGEGNSTHCVEGTWGAEIIDELKPRQDEHLIAKKGFGGFANTQLDTVLRNLGCDHLRRDRRHHMRLRFQHRARRGRAQLSHHPCQRRRGRGFPGDT